MKKVIRCTRCVMDNSSDNTITFDKDGICSYCTEAIERKKNEYFPNEIGEKKLNKLLQIVKNTNKNKKYDCIMGLSGGLDSSYLAYLGHKWGLRVLAIHIDDGYDTTISKNNLKKLINKTGFDYEIIKPDPKQFNTLTLSFMKAGVPNIAIPQDNILFAFLYRKMKEYNIKYFFSGANFSLESILQKGNSYKNTDVVNIKDINRRFGNSPIDKLTFISTTQKRIDRWFHHIETVCPLDYVQYTRDRAFEELHEFCDFEYYGSKHLENILTAFVQLYWFPKKFGVDKRTSHLSSMIISEQMTRDEAIKKLNEPLYDEKIMHEYIKGVVDNLGINLKDFNEIMNSPNHQHTDYKTEDRNISYIVTRGIGALLKRVKH